MKKGLTELVFILDQSGSMSGLEKDTIGGFNSMIEKQRRGEGECLVSTVLFNSESYVLHDRVALGKITRMPSEDYAPCGTTALIDALGGAIRHIGNIHKYAREEDVPEHTLFVITTDGLENASRRFSADEVRRMVERQKKKYGWEFLFIGANIDSVETAKRYGIGKDRAVDYRADALGTQTLYDTVSETVACFRSNAPIAGNWSEKIAKDTAKRGKKKG